MKIKHLVLAIGITLVTGIVINFINPSHIFNILSNREVENAHAEVLDDQEINRVYQQVIPAVVSINTGDVTGSGSIISSDGLILTNAHVVGSSQTTTVILSDRQQMLGDVVAYAANGIDLAMIRIRAKNNLPTVSIAPSGSVVVGQRILAIGNPFGRFAGSLTTGIVSRIDKEKGLIQTDAAINPGYSGGPLLNSKGELIGVNTTIFTRRLQGESAGNIGISFAIPVEQVQSFITAVREGRAPRTAQILTNPSSSSIHEEALARFERILQRNPNDYLAWNGRGTALGNLGRHQEALTAFDQALKLRPNFPEALNGRGMALGNLGRHQEALTAFNQALKLKPNFPEAWNGRGISLGNLGRYQEALESFEEAIKIKPDYEMALRNRDITLRRLRR